MAKIEKPNDAGAHAPEGAAKTAGQGPAKDIPGGTQDAPTGKHDADGDRTIPLSDINSANDE